PVVTTVAMLTLVIFGLFALVNLEVDEFPDIAAPVIFVAVPYPGASPAQVEQEVVTKIEDAIGSIAGVDEIRSTSTDGFGQITTMFEFSIGPEKASQEIRDAISGIRGELPSEILEPIIRKFDPADQPIVSLVISSNTMGPGDLTSLADPGVTSELRAISGVAEVTVAGGVEREISVNLRPLDMAANGVSVGQVVQALQAQNLAAPVGRLNAPMQESSIRLRGRLESIAEFSNVVVANRGAQLVRLGQIADVRDTVAEARSFALLNERPSVGIDVKKTKESSTTQVADGVLEAIQRIQKTLPAGVTLSVVKNAGERVSSSVKNVQSMLVEGALLTVLVVFLFLISWRSTVITGLALPVSVLAAFIAIFAFGFTLNTMSLLGLSLAIGILIDDAIVVRENIVRHVELGLDHVQASRVGTSEIGLAVTATTFSIVAVFVPVGFMEGMAGQWFKPFALTIACAVLVSLFVSFSLDPMLSAYWPDPHTDKPPKWQKYFIKFNNWFDRQAEKYRTVIAWALDHRWWMVALTFVVFVGALVMQVTLGGFGFAPNSDRSEISLTLETPPGSSLQYSIMKADELATKIRSHKEVAYTYTVIGSASGTGAVDIGSIYVKLVPKKDRKISQDELGQTIRKELATIGGITTSLSSGGFGGNQKQIELQIRGTNEQDMATAANMILETMRKVPGTADVGLSTRGDKPEVQVDLNRPLIGSLGLTTGQVAQSLRPAFAGVDVGDWVDPSGKTRDVTVRLTPSAREGIADLSQLPLVIPGAATMTPAGSAGAPRTVPLGQVAAITQGVGPAQIDHLDRDRVISIGANPQGRDLGSVAQDINAEVAKLQLPPSVVLTQGGQVKNQNEVFVSMFSAIMLAVLLMYLILVMQFGSFIDPIPILISLPLSLIGVVLALIITGDTLNIMSMIGIMLLMGIVAKNAILLIDFAKVKHEEGMPLREALIEAGQIRLRPIIMTTVALIA
ncbi:MAG TPA: efflux RND transporter permease subunit, partial [Candidatus Kapabacteria bacterium]|nr:efflux RND transporter permease subunit [Candidatus Kapabacteria bacterium]